MTFNNCGEINGTSFTTGKQLVNDYIGYGQDRLTSDIIFCTFDLTLGLDNIERGSFGNVWHDGTSCKEGGLFGKRACLQLCACRCRLEMAG